MEETLVPLHRLNDLLRDVVGDGAPEMKRATIYKWVRDGVRPRGREPIVLESTRIGGKIYVSRSQVSRFIDRLNDRSGQRSESDRVQARNQALACLEAAGY